MKGIVSKLWKVTALLLVCIMVGSVVFPYLVLEEGAEAKKTNEITLSESTAGLYDDDVGGVNNPYTILEIVPYHDLSQMVWLCDETSPDLRINPGAGQYQALDGTLSKLETDGMDIKEHPYFKSNFTRKSMVVQQPKSWYTNNNNKGFKEVLEFAGFTDSKYYDNNGNPNEAGVNKAKEFLNATDNHSPKVDFDADWGGANIWYQLETLTNNDVFKRYVIGLEDKTIRAIYKEDTGVDYKYNSTMSAAEREEVKRKYNYIKYDNEPGKTYNTKKKVLEACKNFHVRVIVATPDEVNLSVSNPDTVVDTVAIFPETKKADNYEKYTVRKDKDGNSKSLIQMSHMVFVVGKQTNINSVKFYDAATEDAKRTSTVPAPNNKCEMNSTGYLEQIDGHYKHDLTAKAAVQLLTRIRNERLAMIVDKGILDSAPNVFSSGQCYHNLGRVMMLTLMYDRLADLDTDYLKYKEGAVYTAGNKSKEAYEFYFDFNQNGNMDASEEKWGCADFHGSDNVPKYGAKYPWVGSYPGISNVPMIEEGCIFIFNGDENFNNAVMSKDYESQKNDFTAATDFFKSNEICDDNLVVANILRAIANFTGSTRDFPYKKLKVLEIQPGGEFEGDKKNKDVNNEDRKQYLETFYRKVIPTYTGDITIDQVSVLEFIGMTDDLISEYNFLYFGLLTGSFNRDADGNTRYNDTSLNGKIYLHTGDVSIPRNENDARRFRGALVSTTSESGVGIVGSGYKTVNGADDGELMMKSPWEAGGKDGGDVYRLPGNDLTRLMEQRLEDYVNSGQPVLFDNGFFDSSTESGVNEVAIDNSSNMFDFVKFCCQYTTASDGTKQYKYLNSRVFNYSSVQGTSDFQRAIVNADKVMIEIIEQPTEYTSLPMTDDIVNVGSMGSGNTVDSTGFAHLNFKFRIRTTDTTKKYGVRVYADFYADGRLTQDDVVPETALGSGSQAEKVIGANYNDNLTGVDMTADHGGEYEIKLKLNEKYRGMVPWKIEVLEVSSTAIADQSIGSGRYKEECRASVTGFTTIKRNDVEEIRVLQIMSNDGNLNLAPNDPNSSTEYSRNEKFNKYLRLLPDRVGYDVKITAVTMADLIEKPEWFGNVNSVEELADESKNPFLNKLPGSSQLVYNMLMFGYTDSYNFEEPYKDDYTKQSIIYQAVMNYANAGNAVLMSHDNLNMYQTNYSLNPHCNFVLREIMGVDRYGVTLSKSLRDNKDLPYKAGSNKSEVYTVGEDTQNFNSGAVGSVDESVMYDNSQIQGYSRRILDMFTKFDEASDTSARLNYWPGDLVTERIAQTNRGQVTIFPYNLDNLGDGSFPVAPTHSQYYQLDLERDDAVVWYTLAGNVYDVSGNDIRNSYYIYNNKTITYTGMGHNGGVTDQEVKLFINTMVAAYRAAMIRPVSYLQNDSAAAALSSSDMQYLYVDFDTFDTAASGSAVTMISADLANDPVTGENCVLLKYSVVDTNIMYNKKAYITPVVWSHDTSGKVKREMLTGEFKDFASDPLDVYSCGTALEFMGKEFTSPGAVGISLMIGGAGALTGGRHSNVYNVNRTTGDVGSELPAKNVSFTGGTVTAVEVTSGIDVDSAPWYGTYIPLRYFTENGVDYNNIYVSLSPLITYGTESSGNVCFGDGNVVAITKRELFDLR